MWDASCGQQGNFWDGGSGVPNSPLWNISQLVQGEARFDSIVSTGWDPELGMYLNYGKYSFSGVDNPSVLEQQWELYAIQIGQAKCDNQDPYAVADCIQQAYDTLTVATNADGSLMIVGGNYNFNYTTVVINGESIDPTALGCTTLGQQTRCGIFDSLHVHDDQGVSHVDTGNAWSIPIGSFTHLMFDVVGGNWWWSGGIPRPWWR